MPFVLSGSARLWYERYGDPDAREAMVFAHGAGGNTLSWWQQVPYFAARHAVIAYDHRSFGRSRCPREDFHPKHFPADLLAILDAEAIARAALVCQSLGGWTGLRTAVSHPERVACLVLCDTPGGLWTPAVRDAIAGVAERAGREGIRGQAALAPDYALREPERAFLYDRISALNTEFDATLLGRLYDAEGRIPPESLADFRVPTLVVAGERDQLFPLPMLRHVADHVPGCERCEIAGAGHSTYFEQAARFNRVVGEFVARHLAAAPQS